ncbi:hypothetical protein [Maribacter sp. 2304DJ31-5]|uniref:hypothetical protein n=1 Tax=Maribacter sp. 2304DJ31-5 TaxID=3386273 RepID=UPI0039BCC33B
MKTDPKKKPFKVPEGYFDGFEDTLKERISQESPVIPKSDGFKLPEGYFDTLEGKLDKKLQERPKVVRLNPYHNHYRVAAAIAAVVLVIFGVATWNTEKEIRFKDLANADLEAYFENNDLGLSSYEIAEVLPMDEMEITDIMESQIKEENILEYLNETIDHLEELNTKEDE